MVDGWTGRGRGTEGRGYGPGQEVEPGRAVAGHVHDQDSEDQAHGDHEADGDGQVAPRPAGRPLAPRSARDTDRRGPPTAVGRPGVGDHRLDRASARHGVGPGLDRSATSADRPPGPIRGPAGGTGTAASTVGGNRTWSASAARSSVRSVQTPLVDATDHRLGDQALHRLPPLQPLAQLRAGDVEGSSRDVDGPPARRRWHRGHPGPAHHGQGHQVAGGRPRRARW